MWSMEAGVIEMINFARTRTKHILYKKASPGARITSSAEDMRYPRIIISEDIRMQYEAGKGDGNLDDTDHPVLNMTIQRWQGILKFFARGKEMLQAFEAARSWAIGNHNSPFNFATLTSVTNAYQYLEVMLKGDLVDRRDDWAVIGGKITYPLHDVYVVPPAIRDVFHFTAHYRLSGRYFPWHDPFLYVHHPETLRLEKVKVSQMRRADVSARIDRAGIAAAYELDPEEDEALVDKCIESDTSRSVDSIPGALYTYNARNGHPITVLKHLFKDGLTKTQEALVREGKSAAWSDVYGYPKRASPEFCVDVKKRQLNNLRIFLKSVNIDTVPKEVRPVFVYMEQKDSMTADGLPIPAPKPLFKKDKDVTGYGNLLIEDSHYYYFVLGLPGDQSTLHAIMASVLLSFDLSPGMRLHIYLTGDPSGGKSATFEILLNGACLSGTFRGQDSSSQLADTSGYSQFGVIFADEAPTVLTSNKKSPQNEEAVRTLKQILSLGKTERMVLEFRKNASGENVRMAVTYRTLIACARLYACNDPLVNEAFIHRFYKAYMSICTDRTAEIIRRIATKNASPESVKVCFFTPTIVYDN